MDEMTTLGRVLSNAARHSWEHALYLRPGERFWDSPAAVLDPEEDLEGNAAPPFSRKHGLRPVLGMQDVQQIVENAKQQKPALSDPELLRAFQHYLDHDAFIAF
jgi:hypothetical protein